MYVLVYRIGVYLSGLLLRFISNANSPTEISHIPIDYTFMLALSEVKFAQSCPTVCDPMDCRVHGILQARILQWVAFPISRGYSQPRDQTRSPPLQTDFLPTELSGKPC